MSKAQKAVADIKLKHIGGRALLGGEDITITGLRADTFGLAIAGTRAQDGRSFVRWFRWGDLSTPCTPIAR